MLVFVLRLHVFNLHSYDLLTIDFYLYHHNIHITTKNCKKWLSWFVQNYLIRLEIVHSRKNLCWSKSNDGFEPANGWIRIHEWRTSRCKKKIFLKTQIHNGFSFVWWEPGLRDLLGIVSREGGSDRSWMQR